MQVQVSERGQDSEQVRVREPALEEGQVLAQARALEPVPERVVVQGQGVVLVV